MIIQKYNGQDERNHNTYPTSLVYKFRCLTRRNKHQSLKETSTTKLVKYIMRHNLDFSMFCGALNCRRLGLLNELLVKTRILRNQACNSNKIYLPLDSNVSTIIAV